MSIEDAGGTEGPWIVNVHIWHGEDWTEPLQIVDFTGAPMNLAGSTLEWIARPSFAHDTRFVRLISGGTGISIEDASLGLASIFYEQADVEANLPISIADHWEQFFRLTFTDSYFGTVTKHLFTGKLFVYPARDQA